MDFSRGMKCKAYFGLELNCWSRFDSKGNIIWWSAIQSLDQTRMRVEESWQARVCMSVFSTLIARSNEQ